MANDIHSRRSILKQQGRFDEAIPLQLQILDEARSLGIRRNVANAWNYLSMLYYRAHRYADAEVASLESIANHDNTSANSDETLATYEILLARILAAQNRFEEAIRYGEFAILHYATFHNPPTDYLRQIVDEVAGMKLYRNGSGQ